MFLFLKKKNKTDLRFSKLIPAQRDRSVSNLLQVVVVGAEGLDWVIYRGPSYLSLSAISVVSPFCT